jgi:HSP20 family protein
MEALMVEKSHTVGSWPNLYEPLRGIGQKVAAWFAPRSKASSVEDCHEIKVELPGAKAEDVEAKVEDGVLCLTISKQSPTKTSSKKINIRTAKTF